MSSTPLHTVIHTLRQVVGREHAIGLSDGELLRRFLDQRDEAAFEVLVWRHGSMVWSICRRLLHHCQEAEDAFQATFLAFVRDAAAIGKREAVGCWLYRVASRIALKAKSGVLRRQAHELPGEPAIHVDPSEEVVWRDLRPILDEEVNRLPDKYRQPFVLCYLTGLTNDEAARTLGCPKGTLLTRLAWARQRLRGRLARRGLTLSATTLTTLLGQAGSEAAPDRLIDTTCREALLLRCGGKLGTVSVQALALAEGVSRSMRITRFQFAGLCLLTLATLFGGTAVLAHKTQAEKQPDEQRDVAAEVQDVDAQQAESARQRRMDFVGDPLPEGAIARLGTLRFYHGEHVNRVALSPDGKLVASTGRPENRLWDAVTGRELPLRLELKHATFFPAAGKLLAVERQGKGVRVWDVAADKEVCRLTLDAFMFAFSLAPNGTTLAVWSLELPNLRPTFRFGDVNQGKVGEPIELKQGEQMSQFAFSADSRTLVTQAANHTVHFWDAASGTRRLTSPAREADFGGFIALSPDGTVLATAPYGGKRIRLWDVRTLQELPPFLNQPDEVVQPITFSPDGKTLAATYPSPTVRLWDLSTRREAGKVKGKDYQVFHTVFSDDGKTLVGADGYSVTLWDAITGQFKFRHEFGHTYCVEGVSFSPDGKRLVSGAAYTDTVIRVWDPLTGRQTADWRGHTSGIEAIAFAPDGKLVASGSQDRTIRLWDFATGKEVRRLEAKDGMVYGMAFSPDGKTIASGGKRKAIHLWDVATGRELRSFDNPGQFILRVAFSPDGKTLASKGIDEAAIRLWDVASGKELRMLPGLAAGCPSLAFTPDSKGLAAGGDDGTIRLWSVATGEELRSFADPGPPPGPMEQAIRVFAVVFAPDGKSLAAGYGDGDGTVRLWETASGQVRIRFLGHRSGAHSLAFSADRTMLASGGGDRTIMVWDVTGQRSANRRGDQTSKELNSLWSDLGSADAGKAYQAIRSLLGAGPQAVSLLKGRLRPVEAADTRRINQLVADLDSDTFAVREKAAEQLRELGDLAESALRTALEHAASAEVRRRAAALVEQMDPVRSPERLRVLRAVEVLELIGTKEAREVLAGLAQGAPEARLTQETKAALERLSRRP